MKKTFRGLGMVLALLLVLTGCSSGAKKQDADTAAWEGFHLTSYDRGNFIETETGIYKLIVMGDGTYLYYTDKDKPMWLPLCDRADCSHTGQNCNSYIGNGQIGLFENHIYYIQTSVDLSHGFQQEIWRMELNGSNHEKVRDVPMYDVAAYSYAAAFHKGYLLYWISTRDEGTGLRYGELRIASLTANSEEYTTVDRIEGVEGLDYLFFPYEDRVYYERVARNGEQSEIIWGQWELGVGQGTPPDHGWTEPTSLADGGDCFYATFHMDGFYRVDKNTLEKTLILEFPKTDSAIGFTDGTYVYFGKINEWLMEAEGNRELIIYDTDGEEVQRLEFPDGVQPFYFASTEDKVYFYTQSMGYQGLADYYIEKNQIGTKNLKWKKIEIG